MRTNLEKSKFLEILRERPFISYACKKVGISKATIYRWIKNNANFKEKVDNALHFGRKELIDITEMALYKKINEGDGPSIRYFLANNDSRYYPKMPVIFQPPKKEVKIGEKCDQCGTTKSKGFNKQQSKSIYEAFNMYKQKYGHYPIDNQPN
ncbi:MAG: hypothetical protein JST_000142 [Candidatus Parcubacteria bacterium]|jgi:hypothetical protein|nr:MAG: hypothetical protein JST_1250 [Candidatus Parcubacteria bacterium]